MHVIALAKTLSRRALAERGAGLAEYGLLLALIAIACITALTTLGSTIASYLTSISGAL